MLTRLVRRVMIVGALCAVASCGGGGGGSDGGGSAVAPVTSTPNTTPATGTSSLPQGNPSSPYYVDDELEASTFLAQATFGGSQQDIENLVGRERDAWLQAEFAKPSSSYVDYLLQVSNSGQDLTSSLLSDRFWESAIAGDDQLRMRMLFALSQIVVVSDELLRNKPMSFAYYMDQLNDNAFGNYRELLKDVTYSHAMSEYLTYMKNRKADPSKGRMPDENYARELMQLFSIGLLELNIDGTPKLGGNGQPIETYNITDIEGLAAVFTGLSFDSDSFYSGGGVEDQYKPLKGYDDFHTPEAKTFLGYTIPAGTGVDDSIDQALDVLTAHDNMGPFISRQLIQRMTMSNPPAGYVRRVATAFNNGQYTSSNGIRFGTGQKGDLKATIAAILLDETVTNPTLYKSTNGKVREPVLRFLQWARAFNVSNLDADNQLLLRGTGNTATGLGQHPFRSDSVFNFYRPGYVPPQTESGSRGYTVPEMQIVNEGSVVGYINFMMAYVLNQATEVDRSRDTFVPDYTQEIALAEQPDQLVEHLNSLLVAGRLEPETKSRISQAVASLPIRDGDNREKDILERVELAVLMVVVAPEYAVIE